MAFTQLLYQIVFSTKNREKVLIKEQRPELYRYLWGILQSNNCHLYRINGVEDHIHIVISIHQTIAVSSLIRDLKRASSLWISNNKIFPLFTSWQIKYGAFSYHIDSKNNLIEYVKNQEEHHKIITFEDEFRALLKEHRIEFDEKYLF